MLSCMVTIDTGEIARKKNVTALRRRQMWDNCIMYDFASVFFYEVCV